MALTAKNKEGFLTGECSESSISPKKRSQWARCDLMVLRWVLNLISKPIRANVLYAKSSKELWSDLSERYGQLNALELYQLKKNVSVFTQDNSSLVDYYSHLKRNWESIDSLDPLPESSCGALKVCTCQLMKKFLDRESHSKLIQLLMGLNSSYKSVATHILSMDPLPPINKALGLLQKIERQKLIIDDQSVSAVDASAYASTRNDSRHYSTPSVKRPRLDKEDKSVRVYIHCLRKGHTIDECFKLKICTFCNNKGHIKDHCYKFKAFSAKSGKGNGGYRRNANNAGVVTLPSAKFAPRNNPLDDYSASQPKHVADFNL
ncbi:hypothetical protein RND81_14G200400 [Saponaria officinalis]|uniref:Retrotransposon gag domain-containing protein n=1 Tax=Saponaria officinalis TaxID=3572 RepID=A0AAW1GUR0_SAPOF